MADIKEDLEQLKNLNYFRKIYQFARESTGITITLAYMILILSSMSYLHIMYSEFDISIIKIVTLEDILATPIKNPSIILALSVLLFALYVLDSGNRYNARLNLKYIDTKPPLRIKLLKLIVWGPKSPRVNFWVTIVFCFFFLSLYIAIFAKNEAHRVKEGRGAEVKLRLVDSKYDKQVMLLGTTSQFVIVHDHKNNQTNAYQLESVHRITAVNE